MKEKTKFVGSNRQKGEGEKSQTKAKVSFSSMGFLGKSDSAKESGEKNLTRQASKNSAPSAKGGKGEGRENSERANKKNYARSLTEEERKALRASLIQEANSYYEENSVNENEVPFSNKNSGGKNAKNKNSGKKNSEKNAAKNKGKGTSLKGKSPEKEGKTPFKKQEKAEKTKENKAKKADFKQENPQKEGEKTLKQAGKKQKNKKALKVLFLGGVGEIGKNMTALEYGNEIIIIDAGMSFPDEEMPGVDVVLPDLEYLVENKDKIKGIFITHGHEDHIGGLPYLLKQINPNTPVYGTRLTLALADNKIREHRLSNVVMKAYAPGDKVKAGCFEVEFVNVNHSISGSVAFAIETPVGLIYHSGDFKIDLTPVAGKPIDLERIAKLGERGVTLYLGESTNIERPGYTMSETVVGTTFEHLFAENSSRRIIIATFASNVHRLKQIIDVAVRYGRKVALSGRSMLNVVEAASKIGELTIPEGVLVDVEKIKNYFDREIVIISTGTQGEPMSALTRMANGEFNKVQIGENDTVILSATPIPGNEKMIYKVINNLYKKGASVVYESLEKVHVSGHACQEEHKILHQLLKPKFFIPVHGEYRHLKRHALLAEAMGTPASHIIIPEVGNRVELTENSIRLGENFPAGVTIMDGSGSEDFSSSEVMRDRRLIAAEGMFVISFAVSDGVIVGDPVIQNKGVMLGSERDYEKDILSIARSVLEKMDLREHGEKAVLDEISREIRGFLSKKTKQSPLILPILLNV